MFGWYVLVALVAYVLCSLAVARQVYGIQRTALITRSGPRGGRSCAEYFRSHDQEHATALALLAGLLWPVALPACLAYRFCKLAITARPPLTPAERRERAFILQERTRELERVLGMAPDAEFGSPVPSSTP
ncbi:hypothetical protein GXW83_14255 [Streptacidiphilus sp. PB12-B1b]|uniref:hypothetical protein n=1 Tax=Streptacidiphilus sp. PB12-B1b TaxID=2705012 RepID=UPI0015FB7B76|nr:hypothetical protein [Streptacidiphilus sp. PB12-B1b]QMU76729.1 hypothetical protein GXW83_14255 [Streptacidiphilus sp. PB12-B1b]